MSTFNENTVELAALEYFAELGYGTLHGPDIAPGEPGAERDSYEEVFLWGRLRDAIRRINPGTSLALIDEAVKRVRRAESQSPIDENYRLHQLITGGVPVEHRDTDGALRTTRLWLIDFERPENDVRAAILKIQNPDSGRGGSGAVEIDTALGQLLNEAVAADRVVDIYKLAGVETPELFILSDEFLDSLAQKDKPNLQMGLLRRLLNDQIRTVQRINLVQARKFSELLDEAINRYTNRSLTTAEIIAELVKLAKQMRDDQQRHSALGLREDEVAFYDAIVQNDAAVLELGDEVLKEIAQKLVKAVRESVTIDWDLKDSVRATMRSTVRRLLAGYNYPPDAEAKAIELVLEQAELFAEGEVD